MSWKPSDYDIDDAFNDLLVNGSSVNEVRFTKHGVMKGYTDGHVTDYVDADNAKGHNSYDYNKGSDGVWRGVGHKTNG